MITKRIKQLSIVFGVAASILFAAPVYAQNAPDNLGTNTSPVSSCPGGDFLLFPKWYKYLPGRVDDNGLCSPQLDSLKDVWLILAAIIEIMLRVAALAAVIFVVYGGVKYIISQGNPDETTKARSTIINALIGLLLAIMAATFISFIAGSIK